MAMLDLAPPAEFDAEGRIRAVLGDPSASWWLKSSLQAALNLDPVDAVNEAEVLHNLLEARTTAIFDHYLTSADLIG